MVWELDVDSLGIATASEPDLAVSDLIGLAVFKNPAVKVLQLGAENALEVVQKHPNVSYTIALGPKENIQDLQAAVKGFPNAKVANLDPTEDLESQSFKPATYEILLVSDTAAPVADLLSLVKQGGYVITTEATSDDWETTSDRHKLSRLYSNSNDGVSIWKRPLVVKEGEISDNNKPTVQLVYRTSLSSHTAEIRSALESLDWDVSLVALGSVAPAQHVVLTADLEGPLLSSLTAKEFDAIQTITTTSTSVLWITAGGLLDGKNPEHAMAQGLARSLSSEQATLDFRTLDVDLENVSTIQIARAVARIARLQAAAATGAPEESLREREFVLSNGHVFVSRLVRDEELNSAFVESSEPEPTVFSPEQRMVGKIWTKGKVVFEQQQQVEDSVSNELDPSHVEVRVQVSGLAREGVLAITGADYPTTFSFEIGGVVTNVGPGLTDFKPGDRVFGFHTDRLASHQTVPASLLHKLNPKDDLATAVSLLAAYANALYGLDVLAKVQPNETVLVLHNTGSSGVAVAKVAQVKGAIPYVVVETDEESAYLQERLGLDEKQIIRGSHGSVSARLAKLTGDHGADVVFSAGSSVDPSAAREAWRCIARFGRFVDAGRKDVLGRGAIDVVPVARSASYLPFDLLDVYEVRPDVLSRLLPTIVDLFHKGWIDAPAPVESIDLGDLDKAVSTFSEAFGAVKPVIRNEASEKPVLALPPGRLRPRFSANETYLLVGCLGGLGRSLTAWMMESGARRFAFLSRSGTDSESAARLVSDIEAAGAIVQVTRGDATSREDIVRAVEAVSPQYPIRGVVHAAMVLRVSIFSNITFLCSCVSEQSLTHCHRTACFTHKHTTTGRLSSAPRFSAPGTCTLSLLIRR
jgi:NADPH:quinone reductase-like Zn-dependent oxidoreductase